MNIAWRLSGDVSRLLIPAAADVARADGLWRHTCFEAFAAGSDWPGYREFNFSPSGAWAAYAFAGYRAGMAPLMLDQPPAARWRQSVDELVLDAELPLAGPGRGEPLRGAHAARNEDQSGALSYWALRHADGLPDFHHPESFTLELKDSDAT